MLLANKRFLDMTGYTLEELQNEPTAKIIIPEDVNTDVRLEDVVPAPYMPFAAPILAAFAKPAAVTTEGDVAKAVWRAATDEFAQLHYPAGPDAVALSAHRG